MTTAHGPPRSVAGMRYRQIAAAVLLAGLLSGCTRPSDDDPFAWEIAPLSIEGTEKGPLPPISETLSVRTVLNSPTDWFEVLAPIRLLQDPGDFDYESLKNGGEQVRVWNFRCEDEGEGDIRFMFSSAPHRRQERVRVICNGAGSTGTTGGSTSTATDPVTTNSSESSGSTDTGGETETDDTTTGGPSACGTTPVVVDLITVSATEFDVEVDPAACEAVVCSFVVTNGHSASVFANYFPSSLSDPIQLVQRVDTGGNILAGTDATYDVLVTSGCDEPMDQTFNFTFYDDPNGLSWEVPITVRTTPAQ